MEKCPSCSAYISHTSKFCSSCGHKLSEEEINNLVKNSQQKTYKFRSPMLESSVYDEKTEKKKFVLLQIISNVFWFFSLIFFAFAARDFFSTNNQDFFSTALEACKLLLIAFLCLIMPSLIAILVSIEEYLSIISTKNKNDTAE